MFAKAMGRPGVIKRACIAAAALALLAALAAPASAAERPNVVVVMTDDQTVESMRVMPKVQKLIGDEGVTFANNFAANPICCPSRSTFLSGQYSHTTGVLRNSPPFGGFTAFDGSEALPVWLQNAGYFTAHIGKYLNGYGEADPTSIPPGWSDWQATVDPTTYRMYGYTLNENGTLVTYGDYDTPDPATYQTDVLARKAEELIDRRAGRGAPFFLSVAPLAPHVEVFKRESAGDDDPPTPTFPNPRPAPRDLGAFQRAKLPNNADFNEADISDKPEDIRARPLLTPRRISIARGRYRSRLASLLAVDDMVGRIVGALRRNDALDDTVIVFTSDNGFLLGEHRIQNGKQFPYETSIRVPLEIRGPGIPSGEVRRQLAANVDLAPTILDLAGVEAGSPRDGVSLLPLIEDDQLFGGRAIALENWCQVNDACFDPLDPDKPRYRGVRTDRYAFMRYPNGEEELYDLRRDPFELRSLDRSRRHGDELGALRRLERRLESCAGTECAVAPPVKLRARCAGGAAKLLIAGRAARSAVSARFLIPGPDRTDERGRLTARLRGTRLHRAAREGVRANVTVLDGRIVSAEAGVPRAC